jgi:hypothetical protein
LARIDAGAQPQSGISTRGVDGGAHGHQQCSEHGRGGDGPQKTRPLDNQHFGVLPFGWTLNEWGRGLADTPFFYFLDKGRAGRFDGA